jgi:hypothetical protein
VPRVDVQDIEKAIKAIHNVAIMLTGASEYVCEAGILKRLSGEIEAYLERLETDMASLKKEFPGKFPKTLSPDSSLSRIRDVATMLKGDDADIEAKCRSGHLGNELTTGTVELRGILRDTLDTLGGKVARYTFTDRIADYSGRTKSFLSPFASFTAKVASYTAKVVLGIILVAISCFVYLFLTMESEDALLSSVKNDVAFVEEQKDVLKRKRGEYREITDNIKTLQGKELLREQKIELLNLSKRERKIKELIDTTLISIENKEREIAEKNKKIEEIRGKSFLQKLLRR